MPPEPKRFGPNLLQNKVDGGYIPEHIPWEFEEDTFAPMPWIPEGSLISKNRFYEVRREQRPKSYSPPPTPPASHGVPPLDALPFPAIIPPSMKGPVLKRAVSFHPGGPQKLQREASVIDGKVTFDVGFRLRSRSRESIGPGSSEPKDMDLIARQLDAGHQSGLERLKNSMLRLMKVQSRGRHPLIAGEEKHPEPSLPTASPDEAKDKIAEETDHKPLAVRRGLPVPSALKFVSPLSPPLFSPYYPDIPTPFRGSPSAATPSLETTRSFLTSAADKRESINVEDMCTNLRHLVSSAVPKPAEQKELASPQIHSPVTDSTNTPSDAVNETTQTPEDWNFALELERAYGDDPFLYFDPQERMPSFIRPLSMIPDVVTESAEMQRSSGSSATSVSTFPEPPTDDLVVPPASCMAIPGGGPLAGHPSAGTLLSFPSSATASSATTSDEDLAGSGDSDETHARIVISSTDTSPRSSEDKDVPLAIRRLTLLARSSTVTPKVEGFSSADHPSSRSDCSISPAQATLKPVTKSVRFASTTEEHAYAVDPGVTYSPSGRQRPRSSSVPPPQKGSLRNQAFLQRGESKDGRLSRSEPITFPSRIPKKRSFARIGSSGRHTTTGKRSLENLELGGRDKLTPAGLGNENEGRKLLPSLIPVLGPKVSPVPSSLDRGKLHSEKRTADRNNRLYVSLKQPSRTPTPQSAPQQKTSLATSWSMSLRQYVKGGETSGEKRHVSHSLSPKRDAELDVRPAPPVGTRDGRKSSLPVKKASFFRDGVSKATPVSRAPDRTEGQGRGVGGGDDVEGNVVGSVDETGGIGYIAPPRVREASRLLGGAKGERKGPSTAGTKPLRPAQIRNLLGRLTG